LRSVPSSQLENAILLYNKNWREIFVISKEGENFLNSKVVAYSSYSIA